MNAIVVWVALLPVVGVMVALVVILLFLTRGMKKPEVVRIESDLHAIRSSTNFVAESHELVDRWSLDGVGVEAVEPILGFMESHPDIDYGTPGPLIHFIEHVAEGAPSEYEDALLAAVSRRPTRWTVWLVSRVLDGANATDARARYHEALKTASVDPSIDASTREIARRFLEGPLGHHE